MEGEGVGGRTLGDVAVTVVTLTLSATLRASPARALGRLLPNLLNLEAAGEEESEREYLGLPPPPLPHAHYAFQKRIYKHSSLGLAILSNRLVTYIHTSNVPPDSP